MNYFKNFVDVANKKGGAWHINQFDRAYYPISMIVLIMRSIIGFLSEWVDASDSVFRLVLILTPLLLIPMIIRKIMTKYIDRNADSKLLSLLAAPLLQFSNLVNENISVHIGLIAISSYFSWKYWLVSFIMASLLGNYIFSFGPYKKIIAESNKYKIDSDKSKRNSISSHLSPLRASIGKRISGKSEAYSRRVKAIQDSCCHYSMVPSAFLYAFLGNDKIGLIPLLRQSERVQDCLIKWIYENKNQGSRVDIEDYYNSVWGKLQRGTLKQLDINHAFKHLSRYLRRAAQICAADGYKGNNPVGTDLFCGGMTIKEYFAYRIGSVNLEHYFYGIFNADRYQNRLNDIDIFGQDEFRIGDKVVLLTQTKTFRNLNDSRPTDIEFKYEEIVGVIQKIEGDRFEVEYEISDVNNKKVLRRDTLLSHEFDLFYPWSCKPLKNELDELEMQICSCIFQVNIEVWSGSCLNGHPLDRPDLQFIWSRDADTIRLRTKMVGDIKYYVSLPPNLFAGLDLVDRAKMCFNSLDIDNSGCLEKADLIEKIKLWCLEINSEAGVSIENEMLERIPSIGTNPEGKLNKHEFIPLFEEVAAKFGIWDTLKENHREMKSYVHVHPLMVFEKGKVESRQVEDQNYYVDKQRNDICIPYSDIKAIEQGKNIILNRKLDKLQRVYCYDEYRKEIFDCHIDDLMAMTNLKIYAETPSILKTQPVKFRIPDFYLQSFFYIPLKIHKLVNSKTIRLLASVAPNQNMNGGNSCLFDALWAGLLVNVHLLQDINISLYLFERIFSNFRQDTEVDYQRSAAQERQKSMTKVRQQLRIYFGNLLSGTSIDAFLDTKGIDDVSKKYEDLKRHLKEVTFNLTKLGTFLSDKDRFLSFRDDAENAKNDDDEILKKFRKYYGFNLHFFDRDIEGFMCPSPLNISNRDEESALSVAQKLISDLERPELPMIPTVYLEREETLRDGEKVDALIDDFVEAKIIKIHDIGYDIIYPKLPAERKYFRETVHPEMIGFRGGMLKCGSKVSRNLSKSKGPGTIIKVYPDGEHFDVAPDQGDSSILTVRKEMINTLAKDNDPIIMGSRVNILDLYNFLGDAEVAEVHDKSPVYDIEYDIIYIDNENNERIVRIVETVHADMVRSLNRQDVLQVGDRVTAGHKVDSRWVPAEILKRIDEYRYQVRYNTSLTESIDAEVRAGCIRSKVKGYKYSCIQILGDVMKYVEYEKNLDNCRKKK